MNGWTPEQLKELEEKASRIKSPWNRAGFLHSKTGLMWHVCIAWAQQKMAINPKVVDLYHGDDLVYTDEDHDFQAVFNSGIRGIIHKATEGPSMVDVRCRPREIAARAAGLLWGWYHFMRPGDPAKQAEHFFTTIGGLMHRPGILVLDHEDPDVGVLAALQWMQFIRKLSGQTPWLYSGFLIRQQMDNRHKPEFAEYPLWLPEYGDVAKTPLPWQKYTLWQFTGDGEGPLPHSVPGIAHAVCDISSFDGTDEELDKVWLQEEKVA